MQMLEPFLSLKINYASRKRLSFYYPSSLMMDYIVHLINKQLVNNFYFLSTCPNYHPYILRLYYGVLFWIQNLRAAREVGALNSTQAEFLSRFLHFFPLESLTVSSPLLELFKTICTSTPEISTYGNVYLIAYPIPGPTRRDSFIRDERHCFIVPNVPAIFALLEHLNSLINGATPVYPSLCKHIPVTAKATEAIVFGHHSFPPPAERTEKQKWSLASSGIQYPCEATKKLNESFAGWYLDYDFPITNRDDDLSSIDNFLSMNKSFLWFAQVKEVAYVESHFFKGSGSLADCHHSGIMSNQIPVLLQTLNPAPTEPTCSCDLAALFPFHIRLATTARNANDLYQCMAAASQTHLVLSGVHPYFSEGGFADHGDFWKVRPIEMSYRDESSYLGLVSAVKKLMKFEVSS